MPHGLECMTLFREHEEQSIGGWINLVQNQLMVKNMRKYEISSSVGKKCEISFQGFRNQILPEVNVFNYDFRLKKRWLFVKNEIVA